MLVLQKSKAILPEIRPTQSGMKFDLLYLYTTHIIENSFTRLQNYLKNEPLFIILQNDLWHKKVEA